MYVRRRCGRRVECSVSARCLNVDKPRRAPNSRLIRLRLGATALLTSADRNTVHTLLWARTFCVLMAWFYEFAIHRILAVPMYDDFTHFCDATLGAIFHTRRLIVVNFFSSIVTNCMARWKWNRNLAKYFRSLPRWFSFLQKWDRAVSISCMVLVRIFLPDYHFRDQSSKTFGSSRMMLTSVSRDFLGEAPFIKRLEWILICILKR